MLADTKKVQSLINRVAEAVEGAAFVTDLRAKYIEESPSLVGTPLEGKSAEVDKWLDDVHAVLTSPTALLFIQNKVKSHKSNAL